MEFSADSFTLMAGRTLYIGLAEKATSVGCTLNSTSWANVSFIWDFIFSTLGTLAFCATSASYTSFIPKATMVSYIDPV